MRRNINTTDTVFLAQGTYQAVSWSYLAADDATNGAPQPVLPFFTILSGVENHTVVAFGLTIDTFSYANLPRPCGFPIEVVALPEPSTSLPTLIEIAEFCGIRCRR